MKNPVNPHAIEIIMIKKNPYLGTEHLQQYLQLPLLQLQKSSTS